MDIDKKWTFWGAFIYGASAGIVLYIMLWIMEIIHAIIWSY